MKVNTRKLTCLAVVLSIWVVSLFLRINLPIVSIILGLLVPIFGWRDTILFELTLTTLALIVRFDIVLLTFSIGIANGVWFVSTVYLLGLTIVFLSNHYLQKRLIF